MKNGSGRKQLSDGLSLVDSICDRFETACKSAGTFGALPSPEEYLELVPEGLRRELLRELSRRELEYRRRRLKTAATLRKLTERLAPLKLTEEIGRGGMGKVYKGEDDQGRIVAVKVLPKEFNRNEELQKRFEREVEILSRVQHDNIIALHLVSQKEGKSTLAFSWKGKDGIAYYVMEYAERGSLRSRITKTGIPASDAVKIILQICSGLRHAHAANIIHRDIKPENILIDGQDRMKIADFGLAKVADSNQTRTGQAMGTLAYMAPEQQRGAGKVDHRADIYSLGVVLYELLTGRRPNPEHLAEGMEQVDPWLLDVVQCALAYNPADRFQNVDEMIAALEAGPSFRPPQKSAETESAIKEKSPTSPYTVGTAVECRWLGKAWYYKGKITRIEGDRLHISYDDGDQEWTTSDMVRLLAGPPTLTVGAKVMCRWQGGSHYYPGKITAIEGEQIQIKYDDGYEEWTTAEMIRSFDTAQPFVVGDVVQCRWQSGPKYYSGKITNIDGNRIHIVYDDGDQEWTTVDMIKSPW